jgi:phage-related protein
MTSPQEWTIVLYIDEHGHSPVEEFLGQLDPKTRNRFAWSIEQLRVRDVQAREPLVRHLTGKLWELREESRTNIYRLLYFFFMGKRIVLLHGFQKKTDKTPPKEMEIALKRMDSLINEFGGGE